MHTSGSAPRIDPPTDPTGCFWYTVSFVVFAIVVMSAYQWLSSPG